MPVVDILDEKKNKVGEAPLPEGVFGVEVKPHLMHEVVKMQLANRRQGTACTKAKGLIRGGGRKPWKQKGTGRARAGSTRSPLWRGGGTIFGPTPRDYSYRVPQKVRQYALKSALSQKLQENRLLVVEHLQLEAVKTKQFMVVMHALQVHNALIIDVENKNLQLSARNIPDFKILRPEGLNVYDLLLYDHVVITRPALEKIEKRFSA
jgi:large subunit ribosomal protein L4